MLRTLCAGGLFLVIGRPRPAHFTKSALTSCVTLGVVTAGLTLFFLSAVARIPLGTASALEFLGPLSVATYGESGKKRWSAAIAAAGVLLLTQPWHARVDLAGVALAIGAAFCWAAYIVLTQRVGDEVTGLRGLAVSMPVAGVIVTLVAVPVGFGRWTWPVVAIGFALAAIHPVLSFALEVLALRRLTAPAFGALMSLEPAIAVVIGFVALHQVPEPISAAGVALVVVASVSVMRTGGRESALEVIQPCDGSADGSPAAAHAVSGID